MGEKRTNIRRMPINLETIISAVFFLGGMGILSWLKILFMYFSNVLVAKPARRAHVPAFVQIRKTT